MIDSETALQRLLDTANHPVFVSIAADELVLAQNIELRNLLAGHSVVRREVALDNGETEIVAFYAVPADSVSRGRVLRWLWSAEQVRMIACAQSPDVFDRLGDDILIELASCSDRHLPKGAVVAALHEFAWVALHDHSDRSDALCIVGSSTCR